MLIERQRISEIYAFSERMTRVETVNGSGMNILTSDVPPEAFQNPMAFDLEGTWQNANRIGYPSLRIIPAEMDERKSRALIQIIEKLISRHHRSLITLDEPSFELFELAKRINWAKDEKTLQEILTDLKNFNK